MSSSFFRRAFFACFVAACAAGPLSAFDDIDSLFDDPDAFLIEEAPIVEDPVAAIESGMGFRWGGDFSGSTAFQLSWASIPSGTAELTNPSESLHPALRARLWFDARPERRYRVSGKVSTDWPFTSATIYELFADFNWQDQLFFRFGKQSAAWGVSRFYQIADPLSVSVKDPANPTADLEGPLALRVSRPFGVNNLYAYALLKDSYVAEPGNPSTADLGLGLKADFLVRPPKNPVLGNGELSLGVFHQRRLAPKFTASYSTGFGKVQLFTDQVLSWGLDEARLTDRLDPDASALSLSVYDTETVTTGVHYAATAGFLYVNTDWKCTVYGEYLFLGYGSSRYGYLENLLERFGLEQADIGIRQTLAAADVFGYQSRHNSALSVSWSELPFSDKLSAQVLWLQNWVELSGMVSPSITFTPFKYFDVTCGINLAWGGDNTEWVLKTASLSSGLPEPQRLTGRLTFKLGVGSF